MLGLTLLLVVMVLFVLFFFFQSCLSLWSPRLGKRELVYMLLVHLFVYLACFTLHLFRFLRIGAQGWLRFVTVALLLIFNFVYKHFCLGWMWLYCLFYFHMYAIVNASDWTSGLAGQFLVLLFWNLPLRMHLSGLFEPRHDKTDKMSVRPAKTQISLGIRPVWSESSLSAWRKLGSLDTHWAHSEDSDQTGWTPRLNWVFAGSTLILLVLSCRGSF